MNWDLFAAFLVITAVLIVVPGPIVTLIIATGARQGVRAALVTVAGTSIGNAVLLTAIAFGLGWILQNAAALFEVLRWVGAAYLIWLGTQAWRHAGAVKPAETSGRVNFTRGFLVALSNPKTIAFFTAFLPQFVDPKLPVATQLLSSCAWSRRCLRRYRTPPGPSPPAWAAPGSCGLSGQNCLGGCRASVLIGGGIWLSLARRTG